MSMSDLGYIGPYRLLNCVNVGQSSRLWQAYDDTDRRYVGLKTLQDHLVKIKDQVNLLKWEYTVGEKLDDPRLIRMFDFGWDKKQPYMAMEWFFAPDLKQWIIRGYEHYARYLPRILEQMVEGLIYLHSQGWVHRDIKPDNYLFADPEYIKTYEPEAEDVIRIKLIDFALAKKVVSGIGKLFAFKPKTIEGTASYLSPEQIRGVPVDGRSDIYNLGVSFFELLTGKRPFAGESMNDLLRKHLTAQIPSINAKNKNLTKEIGELVKSMLSKDPDMRPKTAKDLLVALKGTRVFQRQPSAADVF